MKHLAKWVPVFALLFFINGCGSSDNNNSSSVPGDDDIQTEDNIFIDVLMHGYTIKGVDGPSGDNITFRFCRSIYDYKIEGEDIKHYGGAFYLEDNKIEFLNVDNDNSYTLDTTVMGTIPGAIVQGDVYIISNIEEDPELDFDVQKIYQDDSLCRE